MIVVLTLTVAWLGVIVWMVASPADNVSAAEYWLTAVATLIIFVYGVTIPADLSVTLQYNIEHKGRLNEPDFRARYGYFVSRFKPGKWGSEFRILSRKTALLIFATLFAELPYVAISAQIVTLTWALLMQCKEHPFAEVGSKKIVFERENPTGWSRADMLEAMSLLSLIGINVFALAFVNAADSSDISIRNSSKLMTDATATGTQLDDNLIALSTLLFTVMPLLYGIHFTITEYRAGRRSKRQLAPSDNLVGLGEGLFGSEPVERVVNPSNQDTDYV